MSESKVNGWWLGSHYDPLPKTYSALYRVLGSPFEMSEHFAPIELLNILTNNWQYPQSIMSRKRTKIPNHKGILDSLREIGVPFNLLLHGAYGMAACGMRWWNDSQDVSDQRERGNDSDITIVSPLSNEQFMNLCLSSGKNVSNHDPRIQGRVQASQWVNDYYSVNYKPWINRGETKPAFDIHHISALNLENGIEEFSNTYIPCAHSRFGFPVLLHRSPDEESIFNVFDRRGGVDHIYIHNPDYFLKNKRGILIIPRVILWAVRASTLQGKPVDIDEDSIQIMSRSLKRHRTELTSSQTKDIRNRKDTCLYLINQHHNIHLDNYWHNYTHRLITKYHYDCVIYFNTVLNKIGWNI